MANLLEKANILITPTAYSDGKIHSAKPIQSLGVEKVVNGDFATDLSNWSTSSFWVWNSLGAYHALTNNHKPLYQQCFEVGKQYQVTFDLTVLQGSVKFSLGSSSGSTTQTIDSSLGSGSYSYTVISEAEYIVFNRQNTTEFYVDNVSIKEVIDSDLNFTRGSAGTRVNAQGLIENSQGNNTPRINYKDGVGSWLIEPQSTNLIPYSELFSNSAWTKTRCTIDGGGHISPSGESNAFKMTATADDGRLQDGNSATGVIYTQSIYVKSATGSNVSGQVDFSGTQIVTFTATDQWQRVTTTSDNTRAGLVRVRITNSGDELYIWGAQLEQQTYATSYIPTNGSVQTRLAETASRSGLGDLIDSTQGVFYAEISALYDNSEDDLRWISLNDSSTNNLVALYYYKATNTIGVQLRVDNVQVFRDDNIPITSKTDFIKIAFKWKQDDVAVYVNGIKKASSTSVNSFNSGVLNRFGFDGGNQLPSFFGNAKAVAVYPILTDEELECLTTR